jgi:hypothetical protein
MDMHMEPLVDELMFSWEVGILTYDRATKQNFTMRVAYHTSMHDFPAYGIFCGCCVHGKMPCPVCREALHCIWLKKGASSLSLICIDNSFQLTMHLEMTQNQLNALKPSPDGNGFEGYGEEHNWSHISGLWRLPYFYKLLLPHNIDVMHNEKNVAKSIFGTIFEIPE